MKIEFLSKFNKDLDRIQSPSVARKTIDFIEQVQSASSIGEFRHIKKIKGSQNAFRVRIGDYRIGFYLVQDTIQLARIVHRKDIYKYFP